MKNKDLSIIVPVYNVEKYLKECLDSLINQSFDNYEIICVNDGSTDRSREILNLYEKEYDFIKVIDKENGGLSSARNEGLKHINGKYIGFIDSDDIVDKDYVKDLIEEAYKNDSDIVICNFKIFYDYKDETYIIDGLNKKYETLENNKRIFLSHMSTCNKIYKSAYFKSLDILFEEGTWYEDLEVMAFLAANTKKISYVDKALVFYRQRENSIMSSKSPKVLDIFNVLRNIYERFDKYNLIADYKEEICYLFIENLLLYGLFRLLKLDDYSSLYKHAKIFLKKYFPIYRKNKYLKDLPLKYRMFVLYNNSFLLPIFRRIILKKS